MQNNDFEMRFEIKRRKSETWGSTQESENKKKEKLDHNSETDHAKVEQEKILKTH